ncbi:MAG: hypothetical protein QW045_01030 [Candidatus Micrarchaeaceae archaeon]
MQKEFVDINEKQNNIFADEKSGASSFSEKKPSKIIVVGEIGGGTKYFDEKALLGFYHMLKNYSNSELPDYLIFNGGVLPEIPKYATKGSADRLHVLEDGINNMDDAVISVKPSLNRIMSLLKERNAKTKVLYIMSQEDYANIKNRNYERLIGAYNNSPEMLEELKEAYIKKLDSDELVLNRLKEEEKKLKDQSNGLEKEKNERTEYLKRKISEINDQIYDYNTIIKEYENLQIEWLKEHPEKSVMDKEKAEKIFGKEDAWSKKLYKEKEEALIEIYNSQSKKLESTDIAKYPEKYKKLESSIKHIESMLEGIGYKSIRDAKKRTDTSIAEGMVHSTGEIFTGNLKASHNIQEIARKIANLEIANHINDAFGRKYALAILQESSINYTIEPVLYNIIESKKINMFIANNPTNASRLFPSNSKNLLERAINLSQQKDIDIAIGGHSISAEVEAIPQFNNGKSTFLVLAPPFINTGELSKLWKSGTKNPYTIAYEKSKFKMSSGIWEISIGNNKNSFSYHLYDEFLDFYNKEAAEQRLILAKKLRSYINEDGETHDKVIEELDAEIGSFPRKLWLEHKIPSEWDGSIIKEFLKASGIKYDDYQTISKLADIIEGKEKSIESKVIPAMRYINKHFPESNSQSNAESICIDAISDAHIGGSGRGLYSPQELIKGFIRKEVKDPPDVLIFGGDILDANYKNFAFEKSQSTDYYTNLPDFLEFIKGSIPKEQERAAIDRYINRNSKQIINISDQQRSFIQSIKDLDLIPNSKKPSIWLISGNHYNRKFENHDDDEATKLSISFSTPPYNIEIISGGDYGIGSATAKGSKFILRHEMSPKIFDSLRIGNDILGAFVGHSHKFDFVVKGNQFIANMPSIAYINSFPEEAGIPASEELRGFAKYRIILRNEKPMEFVSEFISQRQLEKEGYIKMDNIDKSIKQFESLRK